MDGVVHITVKPETERSIPDRFEEVVRRYPNWLAVKMGDRMLTYDRLNRAAVQLKECLEKVTQHD